jgi:alcohol dehydrogenase
MDRFVKIAQLLGENVDGLSKRDAAERALVAIRKLSTDIGIPSGLIELGKRYGKDVNEGDIDTMTGNAQKDACGMTNPRTPKDADVKAIYKAAL